MYIGDIVTLQARPLRSAQETAAAGRLNTLPYVEPWWSCLKCVHIYPSKPIIALSPLTLHDLGSVSLTDPLKIHRMNCAAPFVLENTHRVRLYVIAFGPMESIVR